MTSLKLAGTLAIVAGAIVATALPGVTAQVRTVVSFAIDDGYPGSVPAGSGAGVFSDASGTYFDYRIDPAPQLNWCVDAEPAPPGNLFIRLNRKLDGEAGVLRCSENLDGSGGMTNGVPRNFTLRIANDAACDELANSAAGLPLTDSLNDAWNVSGSALPCLLRTNENPRIRLGTLYKSRAKTTNVDFLTVMFTALTSYEIRSDGAATITPDPLDPTDPTRKVIAYTGTFHLVRFEPGVKAKTVGPAFTMPVRMLFKTHTS